MSDSNKSFSVVVIGSSAGGLYPCREIFRNLPADTGMAFVVIQHLAPNHQSFLAEILAWETEMPVMEITDGMSIESNRVYVIPVNTQLRISEGKFNLGPRQKTRGKYMPIDTFLFSLAREWGSRAIAVILSGTDGDGTIGSQAVREVGGITFAQCEETAEYQEMPNTAVVSGQVDFILPPQEIAAELVKISNHPYIQPQASPVTTTSESFQEESFAAIFLILRNAHGVNFKQYKKNTVQRRIQRRMALRKQQTIGDYIEFLQNYPQEVQALYQDLLIVVTKFFRDEEVFDSLKQNVFSQLLTTESSEEPIRIWVPGCATGEEVYSLAMCLLEYVDLPIIILNNDLCIRVFTPSAQKVFNLIPADVGRPLTNIRLNIEVPDLESLISQTIEVPTILKREVQDQQGHWYSLQIRPYKTTENQITGAVLALVDIDDLKHNSEQLQLSRDYAEAIVQTVGDPLIVLDRQLRIKTANQAFLAMYQLSADQIQERNFFEVGKGEWNLPELRRALEETFNSENPIQDLELELELDNFGRQSILLNAHQFAVADGEKSILIAIKDISERKQFEQQRTQLLNQEQEARLEAEEANKAKDEFISILSHELRTPLNSIQGWAQLLQRENISRETLIEGLNSIERNAKLQSKMIEDLLDISRIVRNEVPLELVTVSLASSIETAVETVKPLAEKKNIELNLRLDSSSPQITGDSVRLQQIIWNLLSNAIKFTPENGRVEIHLSSSSTHAQIRVIDTGEGISPELLPLIFDRFYQGKRTSRSRPKGLGLGLAIVRELVELHQGTVTVESEGQGKGAIFTVRLPLISRNAEISEAQEMIPSSLDFRGIKVLLLEDETETQQFMNLLLEQQGMVVTPVASVAEAWEALNQSSFDLIISDINLPEVSGYTFIQQVRALPPEAGGAVPAIALTAYPESTHYQQTIAAGFQLHLVKPVILEQLMNAIANLLNNQ